MENQAEILFEEGVTAYEQEDLESAETQFLLALDLDPLSEEIKYNLALVYLETKKYHLCNKLIAGIRELDCSEIIDELEKVDTTENYTIPESIPNICAGCFHFKQDSITNTKSGFCSFYHLDVKVNSPCHAFQLADEGKISIADIKENLNKNSIANAHTFMEQLNNESLPEKLLCNYCNTEINLTETERQNRIFQCPSCKKQVNIAQKVINLEKEFKNKDNSELFEIIIEADDFMTEYLYAVRKEIKNRNIDLTKDEEFLDRLNHL